MSQLLHHPEFDPRSIARGLGPQPDGLSASHGQVLGAAKEGMLEEYTRIFKRFRRSIALCALAGVTLGLLSTLMSSPLYTTRTSLDIRSLNSDFMDIRTVEATGSSSSADTDTNLQTQIRLLQSDTLLQQVSDTLLAAPHPASVLKQDLVSRMAREVHLGGREVILYPVLVADAVQRVKVKPLGLTRLVEVTCVSYDPAFSARFCNVLTSTFEQQDLKTRAEEAQKTSEWLTRQVADVRQRAEEAQRQLGQAVGGNGLMLSQTTTTTGEDRLRSLQDELVKAQADRMQQEALEGVARTAPAESLPGVQDNPEHRNYDLKLADLHTQLAQLLPTLTEQNPKVIKVRAEIADAETGLNRTQNSSTARQSNEYSAARHREQLLLVAYQAQQAQVSSDLQKTAQVSLLRKELDSEQQLYQTLLQRAKEAGFASAMQAATIRVVDAARIPKTASFPRRGLSGGIGLAFGALFGTGFAFYRDRNNKVFRTPGDVSRYLHVQELGVIPAAKKLPLAVRPGLSDAAIQGDAIALTRWGDNFSVGAEAYRNATFSILLADSSKRARSYVITSPSAGEGKTTILSNLGVALGKSRLRVCLIDGDLRRPALHRAFALDNQFGLRDILRGEVDSGDDSSGVAHDAHPA